MLLKGMHCILIILIFMQVLVYAAKDTVPSWLDTIPPKISVDPVKKMHSSMFYIKLTSNERSAIWYGINSPDSMKQYSSPVSIAKDGVWNFYYYGEDDFANRSPVESIQYILDQKPPEVYTSLSSGLYPRGTVLKIITDESCQLILLENQGDSSGEKISSVIPLEKDFTGYILAIDKCGNRKVTDALQYQIDTSRVVPVIQPDEGLYNEYCRIRFVNAAEQDIYYSFDPVQPPEWFTKYSIPVALPHGLTVVRYFGKSRSGTSTEIFRKKYTIDTIAPKLVSHIGKGSQFDTVILTTKEQTVIRYETNSMNLTEESAKYSLPLIVPHKGRTIIRARAWDEAGNESVLFKWEGRYDFEKPVVQISNQGGLFTKKQRVYITANEPVQVFYTLDGTAVDSNSLLYNTIDGILISREDSTTLRYKCADMAGNWTDEKTANYFIDTKPPVVKVKISGKMQDGGFQVYMSADEAGKIYYEIGGKDVGNLSPQYSEPIIIKNGQILKYYAIDKSGNRSAVFVMDELVKPRIEAVPDGGIFNKNVKITFGTNTSGTIYWRILPDTVFKPLTDTLVLDDEGVFSLEYFIESKDGQISPIRRNEYNIDWTAPYVQINIKKGNNDSIVIFFESDENASIYYTNDGSNPLYSSSTRTAGNKFLQSRDRIVIPRTKETRLAFVAEDIAKNQSAVSILDVTSPRAVPNVPWGRNKLYDRILSVSLNTTDQSIIYFCRNGNTPTSDSSVYNEPITLMESDTILAFVVDASGYKGQIDTFVYLIDLPPSPQFKVISDTVTAGKTAAFDASESIDKETPFDRLLFRWDFDGDGKFDTENGNYFKASYKYIKPGNYQAVLEITDGSRRTSKIERTVIVSAICPDDMISVNTSGGHHFCVDRYEWPNIENEMPQTRISWVEAKMACIDAGKRLCTAEEWETACSGIFATVYPYGNKYEEKRCPDKEKMISRSGTFKNCNNFKVNDMTGNVWEWVEDKHGDYPLMYGGTFEYGKDAHCTLSAEGNVASRSGETGFRCCK